MLPRLFDERERGQERRPSLPSIRDLFGEDLARPINKPSSFILPPSFSLAELCSSLPVDSRPTSPAGCQGSGLTSAKSLWSEGSARSTYGYQEPYSARRHSDASSHHLMTPSTSSSHDQFITLPPIQKSYAYSYARGYPIPNSLAYATPSSRRGSESHSRSRSSSEAIVLREAHSSQTSLDTSKRRHTIGSSRGHSPLRFPYPTEPMPQASSAGSLPVARSSVKPYTSPSARAFSTRSLPSVMDSSPAPSSAPSPPSTSGEEAPTERRKSAAKYECQFCGKRFNRPSSLKIHHNTHTGEKPFACSFPGCGRHFSVMSNMRRHARIHGECASQNTRDGSTEEISDMPSPAYSSSSSTHDTPVISHASASSAYARSYSSSASSSPSLHATSVLSPSSRRRPSVARSHPYSMSRSPSDDEEDSSSER